MYDWVSNPQDKAKLKALDQEAGALIKQKVSILKKASQDYKSKKTSPNRTPKAGKRFSKR